MSLVGRYSGLLLLVLVIGVFFMPALTTGFGGDDAINRSLFGHVRAINSNL
jgi:hypothetical protein